MDNKHEYEARLAWEGNLGTGTSSYPGYGRSYRIEIGDKPSLAGSADAAFRGDPDRYNPEDLLVSAITACHMLAYLALCARQGICVTAYEDRAVGTMVLYANGGGRFTEVKLNPVVTVAADADAALAERLHGRAHDVCFIANSCAMPISCRPEIRVEKN